MISFNKQSKLYRSVKDRVCKDEAYRTMHLTHFFLKQSFRKIQQFWVSMKMKLSQVAAAGPCILLKL